MRFTSLFPRKLRRASIQVALLLSLTSPAVTFGQGFGGTGGTGGFGGTGGGTGGTGGFGGTGGTGGMSGSMSGATGVGASQSGLMGQSTPTSPFGNSSPTNIFGGFNRTPQGFNNNLGMGGAQGQGQGQGRTNSTNPLGSLGMGGAGGLGRMNGLGGLGGMNRNRAGGGMNNMNSMNGNSQTENKVRAVVRLGFDAPATDAAQTKTQISARVGRMSLPDRMKQVQIEMEGRTAILRGNVPSESDKRMMERLLSLEPGVSKIRNEITISKK